MGRRKTLVRTPFNISPWGLLILYTVSTGLTGYLVGSVDPLKRLLLLYGVGREHADDVTQLSEIESIVLYGWDSCILISLVIGEYVSRRHPRSAASWAMLGFLAGTFMLFLVDASAAKTIGSCLLGVSFPALFNSHTSVSALFPNGGSIVFAFLGAGPDLSILVPIALLEVNRYFGAVDHGKDEVIVAYLVLIGVLLVLEFVFVPTQNYYYLVKKARERRRNRAAARGEDAKEAEQQPSPPKQRSRLTQFIRRKVFRRPDGRPPLHDKLTLIEAIFTPVFLGESIFFSLNIAKKFHVLNTFPTMCLVYAGSDPVQISRAHLMGDVMNYGIAASFIPAFFWGKIADSAGYFAVSFMITITTILTSASMLVPNLNVQWFTIIGFIMWSSYIFGMLFSSVTEHFGLKHVSRLQGSLMTIAGLAVLTLPYIYAYLDQPFVRLQVHLKQQHSETQTDTTSFETNIAKAFRFNLGFLILSVLSIAAPIYELVATRAYCAQFPAPPLASMKRAQDDEVEQLVPADHPTDEELFEQLAQSLNIDPETLMTLLIEESIKAAGVELEDVPDERRRRSSVASLPAVPSAFSGQTVSNLVAAKVSDAIMDSTGKTVADFEDAREEEDNNSA